MSMTNASQHSSHLRRMLEPRQVIAIGLALSLCLAITLLAYQHVNSIEAAQLDKEFNHRTKHHATAIQSVLNKNQRLLESLAGLHAASKELEFSEFIVFSRFVMDNHPDARALEWIPRVPLSQREQHEKQARQSAFIDYRIRELTEDGRMVAAAVRDEYFPVSFIEPVSGNEQAIGFDLASEPERRKALNTARDEGRIVATSWLSLVQDSHKQPGFLLLIPVYEKGQIPVSVEQRRKKLLGFFLGVFQVKSLVEGALRNMPAAGLDIRLTEFETTSNDSILPARLEYIHASRTRDLSEPDASLTKDLYSQILVDLADKKWSLEFHPAPAFYENYREYYPEAILFGGILFSLLLAIYLFSLARQNSRQSQMVQDLETLNHKLQQEISERQKAQQDLFNSEKKYRTLIEHAPEAITMLDAHNGQFLEVNCNAEKLFCMDRESLLVTSLFNLSPDRQPDGRLSAILLEQHLQKTTDGQVNEFNWIINDKQGGFIYTSIRMSPIPGVKNNIVRACITDMTHRYQAESRINKLSSIVEQTTDIVLITDVSGYIEYANRGFEMATGYTREEVIGRTTQFLKSGEHTPVFYRQLWKTIRSGDAFRGVIINRKKNGSMMYEEKTIAPLRDHFGNITHYVSTGKDITERMLAHERIDHMAFHDPLTDLPNRELFKDRLGHAINMANRDNRMLGVWFLDLDRFKTINDSVGHNLGDRLLQEVAKRLSENLRDADTIARFGGDEFTILVENIDSKKQTIRLAEKIIQCMQEPFYISGREFFITASIGIALYPEDSDSIESLITHADIAMYHAKEKGRNRYQFYARKMTDHALHKADIERNLRNTINNNELDFQCQPVINLATSQVTGMEMLMRWNQSGEFVVVGPEEFIPVMEDCGLIHHATDWILHEACETILYIQQQTGSQLSVAVNFAAQTLLQKNLIDSVQEKLTETGLDAGSLIIEITESTLIQDKDRVYKTLSALKSLGVTIALDDFGTGQSSLSHLRHFPIDIVKIDRDFVRQIPQNKNDCELVAAIISMAHNLNMRVIAEGVETESQLGFLIQQGCDSVQGFLFSIPTDVEGVITMIRQAGNGQYANLYN